VQHNYLSTREEILYLVKGDVKKPYKFNVPLLDEKCSQRGWNPKYQTKSEYKRRTMVWTDISEIFRGLLHPCHKPGQLFKVMVEAHTDPGDIVLDLFSGSGQCAVTCRELGRRFISVESDFVAFEKILERLGTPELICEIS
jgi:DNA modification methylase